MALIKCHECSNQISDQAATCPHCGAPPKKQAPRLVDEFKKPVKAKNIVAAAIVILVGAWILWPDSNKDVPTQKTPEASDTCKPDDLQCLGDKGIISAGVYCEKSVEMLATHSVKWTDGTFETKFSRFKWYDKAKGEITYIGDKAEFQNGFGAFTPVIYECDLAADSKTVIDVRVREGRLPE